LFSGAHAGIVYPMQGVIEVRPENMETLSSSGLDLPYIEYGQVQPAIKLLYNGEEYWYFKTLPLKGYGAVLAGYIRPLEAEGHKPILARFFNRIYIYATGITPIGAGKPPGAG
jgi:hypothetical protein